jgi:hypothetical protein
VESERAMAVVIIRTYMYYRLIFNSVKLYNIISVYNEWYTRTELKTIGHFLRKAIFLSMTVYIKIEKNIGTNDFRVGNFLSSLAAVRITIDFAIAAISACI